MCSNFQPHTDASKELLSTTTLLSEMPVWVWVRLRPLFWVRSPGLQLQLAWLVQLPDPPLPYVCGDLQFMAFSSPLVPLLQVHPCFCWWLHCPCQPYRSGEPVLCPTPMSCLSGMAVLVLSVPAPSTTSGPPSHFSEQPWFFCFLPSALPPACLLLCQSNLEAGPTLSQLGSELSVVSC